MFEITIYVWMIPILITLVCFGYVISIHDHAEGRLPGFGNIMMISAIAWAVYAVLK